MQFAYSSRGKQVYQKAIMIASAVLIHRQTTPLIRRSNIPKRNGISLPQCVNVRINSVNDASMSVSYTHLTLPTILRV